MKANNPALRKSIQFFWIMAVLLMTCTACQQEKPPIKIGFVANLSNPTRLSTGVRNGVLMAVDDLNAQGGVQDRKIELIIKDDGFDPQMAVKADQALIKEHVAAIIGHVHSPMSVAALPVINQARMVMISPISGTSKLTGRDDYFFRINPPAIWSSNLLARYAYEKGLRKLAAFYDASNKDYAETKYLEIKSAFEALGGTVLPPEKITSGAKASLPYLAQKLAQSKPDGYIIVANPGDSAMICQHLRKIDASHPILASGWVYDQEFIVNGGSAVEGVVFSHSFQKHSQDPAFLKFEKEFLKRYKQEPWMWEAYGYEALMVLAQALSRDMSPARLKNTLLNSGKFKGLQGDIVFDRFGDTQQKSLLFIVKKGNFIELR